MQFDYGGLVEYARSAVLFVDKAWPMAETASIRAPTEDEAPIGDFDAIPVGCLSLNSLWSRHVRDHLPDKVDFLHVDAERMEHVILTTADFAALDPR